MDKTPRTSEMVVSALRAAQLYWPIEECEPLIASDEYVRLRELCRAVETLRGFARDDMNEVDVEAFSLVLDQLREGVLKARTYATQSIIPSMTWPDVHSENDPDKTYEAGVWYSLIRKHHAEDGRLNGFVGQLPVIAWDEAVHWLCNHPLTLEVNHPDAASRNQAFKQWVATFPNGQKPNQPRRRAWRRSNLVAGKPMTRDEMRWLVANHAPDSWSMPGAPKKNV